MTSAKTATLTFRIEPELKEAVRLASVNEHHSIANMICQHDCGDDPRLLRAGVEISEPQPLPVKPKRQSKPPASHNHRTTRCC